jgi:hypothetical protein
MRSALTKSSKAGPFAIGVGVAIAVVALLIFVFDFPAFQEAYRFFILTQRGRPVEGVVEALTEESRAGAGYRCTRYHVMFTYIVKSEKNIKYHIVHGDESVSKSIYTHRHLGEILPVIYDPSSRGVYLINFFDRIRSDSPFDVWKRYNAQGHCPTGTSFAQRHSG